MKRIVFIFAFMLVWCSSFANTTAQDSLYAPMKKRPKVGVALSGGGAKGFAHIRVLKAIEEAGVPIDMIAGTSMGSIIGGLYAVGYDPDVMEEITVNQEWDLIIKDKVPYEFMPIDIRFNKRKYLVSIPFKDGKMKMKKSVVDGVYVSMLLTRLTLPAYQKRDFDDLSVPFLCIATDMTAGDPVVFKEGSLARSIRSSMSIPFLFAPVDYQDKLLCDGGLLNNFPVKNLREKGADIIIGVDLESEYIEKEKLDNSLKILERLIAVVSQHESNKAREQCDILIKPDIGKANMLSFNDFNPILECGTNAALLHEDELRRLADSLQSIEPFTINRPHILPLDSIVVDEVVIEGVNPDEQLVIKSYFGTVFPRKFSINDIEAVIINNYSTGYYSDMWYEIIDTQDKNVLVMHCKNKVSTTLSVCAHYDNNYKMGVLLNFSMMNSTKKLNRTTLNIDVNIADCPFFKSQYVRHKNSKLRYGGELSSIFFNMDLIMDNKVQNAIYANVNRIDFFAQFVSSINQQVKIGAVADYSRFKDYIDHDFYYKFGINANDIYKYEFNPYLYFQYFFNNEDHQIYVRKGFNVDIIAKMFLADDFMSSGEFPVVFSYNANINRSFPIGQKHSLGIGLVAAGKIGDDYLPVNHSFFIGGQSKMNYLDNLIPFTGMEFVNNIVDYIAFAKTSWVWDFMKSFYTVANCDFGYYSNSTLMNMFVPKNFVMGAGLTLGYKSPFGPVELALSKSNIESLPVLFVNIGFWF
ncbi:MAG: patatin-like phospholipase family protein [Candidatus Limimorpha sp.]